MAEFKTKTILEAQATITFNEVELRALEAMTGYGADAFLGVFYEKLGKRYMQPYEAGLRSLFETINPPVKTAIRQVDEARACLKVGTAERAKRRSL